MIKHKLIVIILITWGLNVFAQQDKKKTTLSSLEKSPHLMVKNQKGKVERFPTNVKNSRTTLNTKNNSKAINSMWDVQFKNDLDIGSGAVTNGQYFFVSQWNNDTIYKYSLNGTLISKNKINVLGIRDMTTDGVYFYGSNASNKIYQMDFNNFSVLDSIICPFYVSVRHIAYDSDLDAFWVGDWDTDIYLIDFYGQILDGISYTDHGLEGMYGSAYDNYTNGGPYLWIFDQGGDGCDIVLLKISTGQQTGIIHNALDDVASDLFEPLAGGMFIQPNLVQGTVTLGGIIQRQRIFGYDLASLVAYNDVGVEAVLSPILHTGCNLSSNETIAIRLRNYGLNTTNPFSVQMKFNNTVYSVNINTPLLSFESVDIAFQGTFNFSQPNFYKMMFYTLYPSDDNNSNDTGYYNVITGNGIITVDLFTDDYPDETYWELFNNFTYDVYASSWSTYLEENSFYSTDVCVDTSLCYGFTIFDFYGDGIYAPGYYEIFFNNQSVHFNDNFSTLFEEVPFIGHCDYMDLGVIDVISPVSSCDLSDEELVVVKVKNFGTQLIQNALLSFDINGVIFTENMNFTLNSLEEALFYFDNFCNLSAINLHELKVYPFINGDMNPFNDTVYKKIEHYNPASIPHTIDFNNQTNNEKYIVEDENEDYLSWFFLNSGGINNSGCAIYSFNPNEPANDWLFSKCLQLFANQTYNLEFYTKAQAPSYPESLKVHLSEAPFSMATLSNPIINLPNITDTVFTLYSASFNVNDAGSGSYYLAFNVYSGLDGWNLYLDDISVTGGNFIENINVQASLKIYPNPSKDEIYVELSNDSNSGTVKIFNMQGQLLKAVNTTGIKTVIDISYMNKGVYYISYENDSHTIQSKFIKM